ncbi:hypothetical protein FB451DRAFT_1199096 [Mycena latifolia]|nr:hypothetical protein FB451DRAFT_1199096 [Mycena latifolia]
MPICNGRACIVANHRMMSRIILEPLHQIQRWNGHYLEHSDLRQLGLRIQLGHDSLEECAVPGTTSFLNVITHRGVQMILIPDANAQRDSLPLATETRKQTQAAEDAKNWQLSDSWLAMAVDIELWTNVWHLGASHDVTTTTTPATEDVHKGASHVGHGFGEIIQLKVIVTGQQCPRLYLGACRCGAECRITFDPQPVETREPAGAAAQTSGEPQERRWSASPPMITTPMARAVVEAIAAVAETTDDPMLVTELDMLWDHVLKRCTWLVQLDEQERLMNGPPSAYLSGRHKRLIPDGESARKKKRERLAEVAAGAGVGSDDEGWMETTVILIKTKSYATVKAWQSEGSKCDSERDTAGRVQGLAGRLDTVGKASMHMADMTGKGNRIHDEPIIENEVEAGRDEQRELTCEHGGAEKTSENGQMMGEL